MKTWLHLSIRVRFNHLVPDIVRLKASFDRAR
jgi:hypothetical protein